MHDLTVDIGDLVAHGVADELIGGVIHDKDLVHVEHLGGFHGPEGLVVLAALEADGLAPLVRPGLGRALGKADHVVPRGRGADDW